MNEEIDRKASVAHYDKIKDVWMRHSTFWYLAYFVLGGSSVVLSTLVASRPRWFGWSDEFFSVLAWTMAVVAGLFTFLNPGERGDRFKQAWIILHSQLTRFHVDGTYTVNHVIDAHIEGEAIIHPASSAAPKYTKKPEPS
jgi:hypothetical protein